MSITYSILFNYFNYYLQTLQTCLQPELNNNTATELSPFQYNFDRQVLSSYPTNVSISYLQIYSSVTIVMVISLYSFISISHILKLLLLMIFLYSYIPNSFSISEALSNPNFLQQNFLIVLFFVFLLFLDRHQEYITRSVTFNQRTKPPQRTVMNVGWSGFGEKD